MNKSIVPHQRTQYFYLPLEDDYIIAYETLAAQLDPIKEQEKRKLSGPSDCKAMIASILERWMNNKRSTAKSEDDLYSYLTIDEWELYLRYRYRRSTIIHCLQEMEVEGIFVDLEGIHGEKGKVYRGTIKKCHYIQNTFAYQLNLPVLLFLLAQLPEQSPFQPKQRPSLGRPKNSLKINGINSDGISDGQNQEYPLRKNRLILNGLILTDEQSKNKRYYGYEASSGQGLQDTIESTKITSNYIDSSLEDITTREGEDSLRRYDEGYAEEKRTSTFNDTPSQHIHNSPTPVDNSSHDASSVIMETGAPDALPVVTQQPAHPMESMRASNESTNTSSLPIANPTTRTPSLDSSLVVSSSPVLYERSALFSGSDWDAFMDSLGIPMEATDTPQTQHNGSDVSSTHPPVDDIPSQPTSPPQDAGSGLSSDAAVTTSNTHEQRDEVQGSATSEVVQGSDTGLSTKETQENAKDKILPEGAGNSTVRRQPKVKKTIDAAMQKRIDSFYLALDEFMQEVMEDTAAKYQRYKKGTEAIHDLLEAHTVTKVRLHKVFFDMWNEKNRDGEYFWRKHMKPHNICSEYESRIMALEGKSNGNGNKGNGHASPGGLHTLSGAPFVPAEKLPVAPRVPSKRRLYVRETTPQ